MKQQQINEIGYCKRCKKMTNFISHADMENWWVCTHCRFEERKGLIKKQLIISKPEHWFSYV